MTLTMVADLPLTPTRPHKHGRVLGTQAHLVTESADDGSYTATVTFLSVRLPSE